jgi:hypothetical protein
MATATQVKFQGFQFPTTTPVPDEVFDLLMPQLSGAELKVLLYICRRTFGFKKAADNISLNQIATGITTRDGRVLDRGTGLCKAAVVTAVTSLAEKGIIVRNKRQSVQKGCEPTTYSLNFAPLATQQTGACPETSPLSKNQTGGCPKTRQGPVQKLDTQQTVVQETERQETVVVDAVAQQLENFGIAKTAATKLTKEYPAAYIREKVAMAAELVRAGSALVAKNPAGWLRRAIEEDYRRDHRQHQACSAGQQATEEWQTLIQSAQPVATEDLQTGPTCDSDDTTENNEAEGTTRDQDTRATETERKAACQTTWNKTLQRLKEQVPSHTFETWIKDTALVSLEKSTAIIRVGSQLARQWLERRLYWGVVRALRDVLNQDVAVQFVTAA